MTCWTRPESAEHGGHKQRQNGPQVGEDLADVVAAGAEDGKDCIAYRSLEWATRQAAICFHVPDLGLDGAASSQEFRQQGRDAFSHAADQHASAPATFPSEGAAKDWLRNGGKTRVNGGEPLIIGNITGSPPLNPVRVRLRLQGQRGPRPTPALVVLPGSDCLDSFSTARAMAEAQLGPLSEFELVDSGSLTKPDIAPAAPAPVAIDCTNLLAPAPAAAISEQYAREGDVPVVSENAPAPVAGEFFEVFKTSLPPDLPEVTTREAAPSGEVVPADEFAWRRAERTAAKAAQKRPQVVQAIRAAPSSAFAKIAAAIEAGHRTRGAVATDTGLGVTRVYRAIDAMKAAGALREGRDGRLALQFDALPPKREEAAPALVVMPSGTVAMALPARKLVRGQAFGGRERSGRYDAPQGQIRGTIALKKRFDIARPLKRAMKERQSVDLSGMRA